MSGYALAMTLGIPTKDAEKLVEGYLNGFPQLKEWRENSRALVKEHGYIKNKVGRIRHLPTAKEVYDSPIKDGLLNWKIRRELEQQYGVEKVTNLYKS